MEDFMNLKKIALGAALLGLTVMPAMAGVDLTVNIGGDDQAHYDFNAGPGHHHPMIWAAAQKLRQAKHDLWKAKNDFHGHKADAIGAINGALDKLRNCEAQ